MDVVFSEFQADFRAFFDIVDRADLELASFRRECDLVGHTLFHLLGIKIIIHVHFYLFILIGKLPALCICPGLKIRIQGDRLHQLVLRLEEVECHNRLVGLDILHDRLVDHIDHLLDHGAAGCREHDRIFSLFFLYGILDTVDGNIIIRFRIPGLGVRTGNDLLIVQQRNVFDIHEEIIGGNLLFPVSGYDLVIFDHAHAHSHGSTRDRFNHRLVIDALKQHAVDNARQCAELRRHDDQVLRTDHDVYVLVAGKSEIHALKILIIKTNQIIIQHFARNDIGFPYEISHIAVDWRIVNILRGTDLLNLSVAHDNDFVRHRQRFFLVVCDKNKGNADLLLDPFQLVLHLLAQLQIQCSERFVKQQDLRLIDQRPGNGNSLLLSSGEQCNIFLFISFEADQLQHLHDFLLDHVLAHLFDLQAEGNIVINIHMREKGIFLEYGIQLPLIGRQLCNILTVKNDFSLGRFKETSQNSEQCCFAAPGGSEQGHKLILLNIKIDIFQNQLIPENHHNITELN